MFDGTACVCAGPKQSRCRDNGGMVCDGKGGNYTSVCHFASQMCNEQVSTDLLLTSCGSCDVLRLVDDSNGSSETLEFYRQGPRDAPSQSVVYMSYEKNGLSVFYESTLKKWVIGNLFALILVGVGIAASTTAVTLRSIQQSKGCLYYPSVCHLRDEIENNLKPEVLRLKNSFERKYGNISQYKSAVDDMVEFVMDINKRLIRIKELHQSMDAGLAELVKNLGKIPEQFPDLGDALETYREWMKNLKVGNIVNIIMLPIELGLTIIYLPALISASASLSILATAGVGAVLAIGFAAYDIITSVREEKRLKERLERAKSEYLKAKEKFLEAFEKMKEFQKKFCETTIYFLRELSKAGIHYHPLFANLYNFINTTYVSSPEYCYLEYIFSRSSINTIDTIKNMLSPLSDYLEMNENDLKESIRDVKEMNQFDEQINVKVTKDKEEPSELFNFVKGRQPKLVEKRFKTLYDLLVYISFNSLNTTSCYWGWNLAGIRSGSLTQMNYTKSAICASPQILSLTWTIWFKVSENVIPCSIFRLVHGGIFKTRYSVLRYIADHILPTVGCYWGHDLKTVRTSVENTEVENSKISSSMFDILKFLSAEGIDASMVGQARKILCGQHKVCSKTWQDFLMCVTWNNDAANKLFRCSNVPKGPKCIPPQTPHQKC
ncbi:hypothetical protein FSP39_018418 [Pinctada imbricata]|uniref:Uncharacterized protein n=1 Tax=Pinctada imbricata TaxID=66713 RepID=A0AA89BXR9_PINIB|nr:hypothetical protein FSP39_018418 [Pinctada imbricata]